MKFYQDWTLHIKGKEADVFPASVPGNAQADYAAAHGYGDLQYGDNCKEYLWMEKESFVYETRLQYEKTPGEDLFFVSKGIDYAFSIFLNEEKIWEQEGTFTPVELDLTDMAKPGDILRVEILPPPERKQAQHEDIAFAKPPVGWGWDWQPRVVPTGIWDETYLETRRFDNIDFCEVTYRLSEDLKRAEVRVWAATVEAVTVELTDPNGKVVYSGQDLSFTVEDPMLWWCNEQGEPNLYRYRVFHGGDEICGRIGFRRVELVMNEGEWERSNEGNAPRTRARAPMQLVLNGRPIFCKGSNWVGPELFPGTITEETYRPLLQLAKDAHMNLLRCWGGSGSSKDSFYDLCDEMGIMIWHEFPLSCNNYINDDHYLEVLEQEAVSLVTRIKGHPCIAIWCGGNELFNAWSGMDDQSLALRLLDSVCYRLSRDIPFLKTSPLYGVGHGPYLFRIGDKDIIEHINTQRCTAYTEFGVPGPAPLSRLKKIIPPEEWEKRGLNTSWQTHHAYGAFSREDTWFGESDVDFYFGKQKCTEDYLPYLEWMQCEGYKAIFEEARRQRPYCSMALNWCYNEPWITAANNSLLSYPAIPKPAYYAVQDALRPVMASARNDRFDYRCGDLFRAELWFLNDTLERVSDSVEVLIRIGSDEFFLMTWETGEVAPNSNRCGHMVQFTIPETEEESFTLLLKASDGRSSEYKLAIGKQA